MKTPVHLLLLLCCATAMGQQQAINLGPQIPMPAGSQNNGQFNRGVPGAPGAPGAPQNVIYEPPPPVVVDGTKAAEMTDEEMREFLEAKIFTIYQDEGAVELLRVAPGYALTVTFDEPVVGVVMGDPNLMSFVNQGRTLVLSARQRSGDTSMQLIFGGSKILNYHLFIADNFVNAQSTIRVISGDSSGSSSGPKSPYISADNELDIAAISRIISNYDAMVQEKSLDTRTVRRMAVFRKSDITSFEIYYIYLFKNGPAVISFAYTNPFNYPIKYDESNLRIQVGNMQFVPDFVSFHNTTLTPGQTTTGFAILTAPPFSFKQPFELIWK